MYKLERLDENIYMCELWNSLPMNGHFRLFFSLIDGEPTNIHYYRIGYFGTLNYFPEEEDPKVVKANQSEMPHLESVIEHKISSNRFFVQYGPTKDFYREPVFYPRQIDIDMTKAMGGNLDTVSGTSKDIGMLWDFYDLYPAYLERMLNGHYSLQESLNFSLDKVETDLQEIRQILNRQENLDN